MFLQLIWPPSQSLFCLFLFLFLFLLPPHAAQAHSASVLSFNNTWHVLGPFQIGTRGTLIKASWGADPLEYAGGFRSLTYDPTAAFPSALPANGTARWNTTNASQVLRSASSINASLSIGYSNVDWNSLRVVYGWAAVQYQAWVRGEIIVGGHDTQHVILYTDSVLEFWVGNKHYFGGDFYSYRNAPPVLYLAPGSHRIDIRLVRDVRAFGGVSEPTLNAVVDVRQVAAPLELAKPGILVSDVVNGRLASPIGCVYLRNNGQEDIEILGIRLSTATPSAPFMGPSIRSQASLRGDDVGTDQKDSTFSENYHIFPMIIVAGQTKPVTFNVFLAAENDSAVVYDVMYKTVGSTSSSTLSVSQSLNYVALDAPHKFTYIHPGGVASYAVLRAPAKNVTSQSERSKLPILLQFHGAGLDATNPIVSRSLDSVSDLSAWTLFPSGVTPWSGDDWHSWGFADVEAAIAAIPEWIEHNSWTGPSVNTDRWVVSGHSNGGQGTWYALTHRPDKVLAAAPVAGYTSIQMYVPYELWQSADPKCKEIISASLNSYRHEMLMSNARGIPIQQQHGEVDNNVPAYHSRLLSQKLHLEHVSSNYNEVPGFNHWWEDVMTTPQLVKFYYSQTESEEILPRRLREFTMIVGDPGDMGSKSGIKVKHLEDPGRYGKVSVRGNTISTSNVQDVEIDPSLWMDSLIIDKSSLDLSGASMEARASISLTKSVHGWRLGTAPLQRNGRQLGSMSSILRTHGPFIIRHSGSADTSHIAVQISRNLHQYLLADANIVDSVSQPLPPGSSGNVVTLGTAGSLERLLSGSPLRVDEAGVLIRDHTGQVNQYGDQARGAAFLRPLEGERLELVLWGADEEGLQQAARMVPLLTGVGQPDFVVFGKSARWKGIGGVLAMGFFDSNWEVTAGSVVENGLDTHEVDDWLWP